MAPPDAAPITLLEKADIVPVLLQTFASAIYGVVTGPFRGEAGAPTYYQHVAYTAIRTMLARTSIAQSQYWCLCLVGFYVERALTRGTRYLNPSTTETYEAFAKRKGFTPESVTLADGTKAHWLGKPTARTVIIYYHGGGYCLPATLQHISVVSDIVSQLNAAGKDAAALFLSYTLAPAASYPRQLTQGVELLRQTLQHLGKHPSEIVIGGDSAGGNLALGVLSHLSHPHPSIAPIELSAPLRAAVLIAPWVSFEMTADSFRRNAYKDCIGPSSLTPWSRAFMGGAAPDHYNQPLRAPASWWEGLKVEEVLIIAGADEVLIDQVKELAGKIESVHPKTTTIVVAKEAHDSLFINGLIGYTEPSEQDKAVRSWISSRL